MNVNEERKTITDVSTAPSRMTFLANPQLAYGLENSFSARRCIIYSKFWFL